MNFFKTILGVFIFAAIGATGSVSPTLAQGYPSKLVRIVVPYAPGGGVDVIARAIAEGLSQKWGQSVIVENKPGASTFLGAAQVAKAAADGHTLLLTSESTITSNPFLFATLPYDARNELTPVTQLVSLPQMVVANSSLAAGSVKELVEAARKDSGRLNYASYGSGSLPHLFFEGLNKTGGIHIAQVSYKGIIPAVTAVVANEAQLTLLGASLANPHIQAGRVKPLAVVGEKRLASLPNVPTLTEAGFGEIDPGESWFGLFVTGGSPADVPAKIQRDVAALFEDAAIKAKFVTARGLTPIFSTPADFSKVIAADMTRMERLIKLSGAKGEP